MTSDGTKAWIIQDYNNYVIKNKEDLIPEGSGSIEYMIPYVVALSPSASVGESGINTMKALIKSTSRNTYVYDTETDKLYHKVTSISRPSFIMEGEWSDELSRPAIMYMSGDAMIWKTLMYVGRA